MRGNGRGDGVCGARCRVQHHFRGRFVLRELLGRVFGHRLQERPSALRSRVGGTDEPLGRQSTQIALARNDAREAAVHGQQLAAAAAQSVSPRHQL
jgi:hypothetical protein